MVRILRRSRPQRAPEAGDPVACLPAHAAIGAQKGGGIRIKLEEEEVVVRGFVRHRSQLEEVAYEPILPARGIQERAEGAKKLHGLVSRSRAGSACGTVHFHNMK